MLTLNQEELQELQKLVDAIPTGYGMPIVLFFLRIHEERRAASEKKEAEIKELKKED